MMRYATHSSTHGIPLVVPAAQWSRHSCLQFAPRSHFHGSIVSRRLMNNFATLLRLLQYHDGIGFVAFLRKMQNHSFFQMGYLDRCA
jgi:hypothetical protein